MATHEKANATDGLKPLLYWVQLLKSDVTEDRIEAAEALANYWPTARESVPSLIETIKDHNPKVRSAAVYAIQEIGLGDEVQNPTYRALLNNSDASVRNAALACIHMVSSEDHELVLTLIDMLNDPDAEVYQTVESLLRRTSLDVISSALSVLSINDWIALLTSVSARDRAQATIALAQVGSDAIPYLQQMISDPVPLVRRCAALALGFIGPSAAETVIFAINDEDSGVRSSLAHALGQIGSGRASGALLGLLRDQNAGVRSEAAFVLGKNGSDATEVTMALMDMLMDPDSAVRFEAVRALGSLSAEATVVIPALVAALKDPNDRVRSEAAQVLQEKVPHAYYPLLSLGLVLSEFVLSSSAETALIQYLLHPESAHLPHTLASVLNDPNPGMRSFAAQALATFRYNLADVIPAIAHALFDSESDVRFWSAVALEKSGKDAKEAIPALLHALHDSSESVPPVAARALGGIGDEAMIAVPALCEALQHEDPMTSFFSASALTCINPTLEAPIAVLVETLSNATDPQFRRLAVNALERLGPLAKLAVPTLLTALADQNQDVRQAVARALSVITER